MTRPLVTALMASSYVFGAMLALGWAWVAEFSPGGLLSGLVIFVFGTVAWGYSVGYLHDFGLIDVEAGQ